MTALQPISGYLRVNGGETVARTIEVGNGVMVDVDADGRVMGLEVIGRDDFFAACMDALRVLQVAPKDSGDNRVQGRIEHADGYSHAEGFYCLLCMIDRLVERGVPEEVLRPVHEWLGGDR